LGDIIYACKMGLKTLYYNNTFDMSGEVEFKDEEQAPLTEEEESEEYCDSCVL